MYTCFHAYAHMSVSLCVCLCLFANMLSSIIVKIIIQRIFPYSADVFIQARLLAIYPVVYLGDLRVQVILLSMVIRNHL